MQIGIGRMARRWRGTFFVAVCGAGAFLGEARTVALWPLEQREDSLFDGRCLVDSTNNLSLGASAMMEASGLDWGLPPNPDAAFHMVERANESAVRSVGGSPCLFNAGGALCRHVARDRDFTIEGWLKFADLPASNDWWFIVGGYDGSQSADQRWMLSFRAPEVRAPGEGVDAFHWHVYAQTGIGNVALHRYAQKDLEAMTNGWRHLALVHEAAVGNCERWTFYLDGIQLGQCTGDVKEGQPLLDGRFEIGARVSSGNTRASKALFDYWRLSDAALSPDKFLCAGDAGTARPAFETVAYWPLDVTESGAIDSHDVVGDAALSGGFWTNTTEYAANRIAPRADAAFVNPPNATVELPNGNAGCVQGAVSHGTLLNNGVGTYLSLTNDFTVEGWIAPRVVGRDTSAAFPMFLFGTRHAFETGWALQLRYRPDLTAQFDLYAVDDQGELCANVAFPVDVSGWYETWRHVALVYNHDGGAARYGRWELFLDGVSTGWIDNGRTVDVRSETPMFVMLNRPGMAGIGNGFTGRMDCMRVSGAALSPAQFMCATNGTAATDVLALWPLNVVNGAYFDLRDVVGAYHLLDGMYDTLDGNGTFTTREYCARGVSGVAPSIPNPETSAAFRGDPARTLNGSVRFRDGTDGPGKRASLVTGSQTALAALGGEFTLECYFMRESSTNDNQEVFFALSDARKDVSVRFFYAVDKGFVIWQRLFGSELKDTPFAGTKPDDLASDVWHHLALVHAFETEDGESYSVWRLFIDGVQKGAAARAKRTATPSMDGRLLLLGGRHWREDNSLRGLMSSVRLSRGVRPPEAFLCAGPTTPAMTSAVTRAFWPLDMVAGTADLSCWLDADYGFTSVGTVGAAAAARPFVPRIAELGDGFGGHSRVNGGSVSLASGAALVSPARGLALEPGRTFTVEGWIKWDNARTADETIFQVGRPDSPTGGIRLFIDKSEATPNVRLWACGRWPNTPYADGVLLDDVTGLAGVWTHLALVHDLTTWRLYVDGRLCGTLANLRAPAPDEDYFSTGDLTLGSSVEDETFVGAFDLWRLSSGVREPDDFLYTPPRGTVFILR